MSTLAQNLERLRNERGLSRVALSRKAGLGDSSVNDLVSNPDRSPRVSSVEALARALGVPLSDLIQGAGGAIASGGLSPIDIVDIRKRGKITAQGISILAERNDKSSEFYIVDTADFTAFGYAVGDLIAVDVETPPSSGQIVAVMIGADGGPGTVTLRYFAEPLLFGFEHGRGPVHEYAAAPGVKILGRVVASVRLCPE